MLTVGTAKRLEFELRNLAGALANGTVSFSAIKPDGTTSSPSPTNDGTGLYHVDISLDQAGRWTWIFTSTGAVEVTDAGIIDVASATAGGIISLDDAKTFLKMDESATDDMIESMIAAATAVVEYHVGDVAKRSVTERHYVTGASVVLDSAEAAVPTAFVPVDISAVSVDVADLYVSNGVVYRTDHALIGNGTYDITYVSGRSSIPPAVAEACKVILQHLWKTQRGTAARAGSTGGGDTSNVLGYAVPNRALELLATSPNKAGGFA